MDTRESARAVPALIAQVRLGEGAVASTHQLLRFQMGATDDAQDGIEVPLPLLYGYSAEHWCSAQDSFLTGQMQLSVRDSEDIEQSANALYQNIYRDCVAQGYPHLVRTWTYLDRINEGEGDAERYRRFCLGRHRAIAQPAFEQGLPAATVIGSQHAGLRLFFIASRQPGIQVENPRQTSAFLYPREYGPVSPSFSRATLLGRDLLVSGTAAVVGHRTLHPDDASAQTQEIVSNLTALLDHARAQHFAQQAGHWEPQLMRVYLRRAEDLQQVLLRLQTLRSAHSGLCIVQGDICRSDLAVELEGVWTFQPAADA